MSVSPLASFKVSPSQSLTAGSGRMIHCLSAGMQMDRHVAEGAAPFHHRGVVVRVRDRDPGEAAERLDDRDRRRVEERDAIPQHVALRGAHQQRALADPEWRDRSDPDQAGLILAVAVEMPPRERVERGPLLPGGRHELALVLADRACRRRLLGRTELGSAGFADEGGHGVWRWRWVRRALSRIAMPGAMPKQRDWRWASSAFAGS